MKTQSLTKAVIAVVGFLLLVAPAPVEARAWHGHSGNWVAAWTTSPQGVYPVGYTAGQPGPLGPAGPNNTQPLLTFAFPDAQAHNQTIRMVVHPSIGGRLWRVRLNNLFGANPVTFGRAYVGLQKSGGDVVSGTNRPLLSVNSLWRWRVGVVGGADRVRADAQPYLGPRSGVAPDRRHDG